ncbi:hypothetical protein EVAR_103298_1 [Eumeta japonica]|uniref:Uncharacterized protein n=1 Tax=Eumeta variegata TaxID=151549 RepID=A0A4C1XNA5_EUMVA|nr:hypothetical protein EVAR_103298_1 [Eumeta japonica]
MCVMERSARIIVENLMQAKLVGYQKGVKFNYPKPTRPPFLTHPSGKQRHRPADARAVPRAPSGAGRVMSPSRLRLRLRATVPRSERTSFNIKGTCTNPLYGVVQSRCLARGVLARTLGTHTDVWRGIINRQMALAATVLYPIYTYGGFRMRLHPRGHKMISFIFHIDRLRCQYDPDLDPAFNSNYGPTLNTDFGFDLNPDSTFDSVLIKSF